MGAACFLLWEWERFASGAKKLFRPHIDPKPTNSVWRSCTHCFRSVCGGAGADMALYVLPLEAMRLNFSLTNRFHTLCLADDRVLNGLQE